MKVWIIVFIVLVLCCWMFFVGIPYKYDLIRFVIEAEPEEEIYVEIAPTTTNTFLGMTTVHSPPYTLSLYCVEAPDCLDGLEDIDIQVHAVGFSEKLTELDINKTAGGLSQSSNVLALGYDFSDPSKIDVSVRLGSPSESKTLEWSLLGVRETGWSLMPIRIYLMQ